MLGAAALAGCAGSVKPAPSGPGSPPPYKVDGKWYQPLPDARGFRQRGIASWYGTDFHGKKTSNGETYDMHGLTAAHKTLPFNTMVRVIHLENGRQLDVRINDRGPFVKERIIDLSYRAADRLGIVGAGTGPVEVVALGSALGAPGPSVDYAQGRFTFQVGAFVDPQNAERMREEMERRYGSAHITRYDRGDRVFHRVRVGRFSTLEDAERWEGVLARDGLEAFCVAE